MGEKQFRTDVSGQIRLEKYKKIRGNYWPCPTRPSNRPIAARFLFLKWELVEARSLDPLKTSQWARGEGRARNQGPPVTNWSLREEGRELGRSLLELEIFFDPVWNRATEALAEQASAQRGAALAEIRYTLFSGKKESRAIIFYFSLLPVIRLTGGSISFQINSFFLPFSFLRAPKKMRFWVADKRSIDPSVGEAGQ